MPSVRRGLDFFKIVLDYPLRMGMSIMPGRSEMQNVTAHVIGTLAMLAACMRYGVLPFGNQGAVFRRNNWDVGANKGYSSPDGAWLRASISPRRWEVAMARAV